MSPIFGILIILACAASCQSLTCKTCISMTSNSCTGPSSTCPSGSVCGALYTQTRSGGSTVSSIYGMSCTPRRQCSASGSISAYGEIKVKVAAGCCTTDNCIPTLQSSPLDSSNPNGLACRSCFSTGSAVWCDTTDTIQCTGDENMCISQTVKITGSASVSTVFRGCATKSICDIGNQHASSNGLSTDVKIICTSGSPALRYAFYLPALTGLLLLKFFF
ncbi:phospholipase A2 inhibitor 25 kDa subunit-like [Hyperolius riggenbachi]|uniref:phospholipase A2 inhibitor 25 kDa subunit-like n=1 Tax=Hyperolius riggenbachi TaxID=752182 RepID=UPI0035A2AD46